MKHIYNKYYNNHKGRFRNDRTTPSCDLLVCIILVISLKTSNIFEAIARLVFSLHMKIHIKQ